MSRDRYRCTFDSVAETYERSRPLYADDAVGWIARRLPFGRVLDLGAGTGKLTRQLLACGADVVAVEPGEAMRAVREITLLEKMDASELHGKTGWAFDEKIGWWVGWVERDGKVYPFALNIALSDKEDVTKRIPLGRDCLKMLGKL